MTVMVYIVTLKDGTKKAYHTEPFKNWLRGQGNHVALDFKGRLIQLSDWLQDGNIVD